MGRFLGCVSCCRWRRVVASLTLFALATSSQAQDMATAMRAEALFESGVARLFVRHCLSCHNESEPAGGLDLTHRDKALAGGDSGAVIAPGDVNQSWLVERIREGSMPPADQGDRLPADAVSAIADWVAAGAHWPADRTLSPYEFTTDRRAGKDWWSLQTPMRRAPPETQRSSWVRTPIDAFVFAELEKRDLAPSAEADRAVLIRRATFDLWGLPPSPEAVRAFVRDPAPDAYERLVERLLDSPHYGERWARHWLDVARFGETNGYETNTPRPNAWPYRDYVIDAFNADKPYDQFVVEQLAGDQLGADAATGFLVGGAHDIVGIANIEGQLQQRANDLDDFIATTTTAFLGLTTGCARCHDHKFDAITQRDYYALSAALAGVQHAERVVRSPDYDERLRREPAVRAELAALEREMSAYEPQSNVAAEAEVRRPPVHPLRNVDRFAPLTARFVRFTALATNQFEPCIDELEIFTAEPSPRNVALASAGARASASGTYANGTTDLHKLEHVNDGRYGNGRSWISEVDGGGWVEIELAQPESIDRVVWARDREGGFKDRLPIEYRIEAALAPGEWTTVATSHDRRAYAADAPAESLAPEVLPPDDAARLRELLARRESLRARLPEVGTSMAYIGAFGQPGESHILYRGDPLQKRDLAAPSAIAAVGEAFALPADAPERERRLALARWIASADNPLTARVIVNRLWHYHFGSGLVRTPSNLGFHGGLPTHPELLDWLATEAVERGWRLKDMHRLIVRSAVYRQSSAPRAEALSVDADCQWLWRFPPRRLEAEPIRDAILAASGSLDLRMGGPGYDAFEPNNNYVHVYIPRSVWPVETWRRMVYQMKPRMEQDGVFGAFDCPDASQIAPDRPVSTTALQALNLLNSSFVIQQTEQFAARLIAERPGDSSAQVERAFWLALARPPDDGERAASLALIERYGLASFCRALYNTSEFVYIE